MAKKTTSSDDCSTMYSLVCEKQFHNLTQKQDEMLALMRGHNSQPGLVQKVESIRKVHHALYAGAILVLSTILVQVIIWLAKVIGMY